MKRIICIILCLLLPASAFAVSDLDIMVTGHNMHAVISGAQELTGSPEINSEKGTATFDITDKLHDVFFIKEGEVTGFGCVCQDPAQEIEFLAQCVTACYNFGGTVDTVYDPILSQFMFARGGNSLDISTQIPGLAVHITKESFGYAFVLIAVN